MGLLNFLRKLFGAAPGSPRPRAHPPRTQAPAPQTNWPAPPPAARPPAAPRPVIPISPPSSRQPPQRREMTLDLDASQFQPLTTGQAKAQAEGQQFTGFFEFG